MNRPVSAALAVLLVPVGLLAQTLEYRTPFLEEHEFVLRHPFPEGAFERVAGLGDIDGDGFDDFFVMACLSACPGAFSLPANNVDDSGGAVGIVVYGGRDLGDGLADAFDLDTASTRLTLPPPRLSSFDAIQAAHAL